jgi:hypothetical protein
MLLGMLAWKLLAELFFEFLKKVLGIRFGFGSLIAVGDTGGSQVPPPSCEGWNEKRSDLSLAN